MKPKDNEYMRDYSIRFKPTKDEPEEKYFGSLKTLQRDYPKAVIILVKKLSK